jgi:large subunit ribosomal protein L5e
MEEIYTNAYAASHEDPTFQPTDKTEDWKAVSLKYKKPRLTYDQRKAAIQAKIAAFKESGEAAEGAEEDDDEDDDDE